MDASAGRARAPGRTGLLAVLALALVVGPAVPLGTVEPVTAVAPGSSSTPDDATPAPSAGSGEARGRSSAPSAGSGEARGRSSAPTPRLGKPVYTPLGATDEELVVSLTVSASPGQRVVLEREKKKGWSRVATAAAPLEGQDRTVTLRVPSKAGEARYRVVVLATADGGTARTPVFTIFQSDSRKHAKYIAKARRYMAAYCQQTPIYIDSPSVRKGDVVGQAWSRWQWLGTDASWTQTIELRSGLSARTLRHTALHECAHVVQVRPLVHGQKAYNKSRAAIDKTYGNRGASASEQQADCMAYAITKDAKRMYYASSCKGKRLSEAKALWKAYGKKYQDPNYAWTWKR